MRLKILVLALGRCARRRSRAAVAIEDAFGQRPEAEDGAGCKPAVTVMLGTARSQADVDPQDVRHRRSC